MYNEYFGLEHTPFRLTPDPRLFYPGGGRGEVLDALVYAITSGEGIIKVVGEVGTGKTMLCRMLEERLPKSVDIVYLANPSLTPEDILHAIALELGLESPPPASRIQIMHAVQQELLVRHANNRRVVALVEEAQSMPRDTLEEIRLLSNLETKSEKLLQIVLFGQPELDDNLAAPEIRQLRERITHGFMLKALNTGEIREYMEFRLRASGYRGREAFSNKAYKVMSRASEGLTRRVNILADKSLLAAFAEDTHDVSDRHVKVAIEDTQLSVPRRRRDGSPWMRAAGFVLAAATGWVAASWYVNSPQGPRPEMAESRGTSDTRGTASTGNPVSAQASATPPKPAAPPAPAVAPIAASRASDPPVEQVPNPAVTGTVNADIAGAGVNITTAASGGEADGVADSAALEPQAGARKAVTSAQITAPRVAMVAVANPDPPPPPTTIEAALPQASPPSARQVLEEPPPPVPDPAPAAPAPTPGSAAAALPPAPETPLTVEPEAAAKPPPAAPVPPVAAVKSISGAASAAPADILDERLQSTRDWLRRVNPDNYSIQVLATAASRRLNLRDFLKRRARSGHLQDLYVYETSIDKRPWYGVLYGEFSEFSKARQALGDLPESMRRHRPFIRNISDIKAKL